MADSFHSSLAEPDRAVTSPEAAYGQGVALIADRFHEALASALSTVLEDHGHLVASVLRRRIAAPLIGEGRLEADASTTQAPPVRPPKPAATGRRTARELVLDALANATDPMTFADVTALVAAAGGSELGAQKVRTDLLKKGHIVNRRGLYTITDTGRERRAAYG